LGLFTQQTQLTPQPLVLAFGEISVEFKAIMLASSEKRARSENIWFKVTLLYVGNLGPISGAKLCHARFCG